jgi:hypothetical protein
LLSFRSGRRPWASAFGLCEQVAQGNAKAIGHLFRDVQAEADLAEFDGTHISAMDASNGSEFLLGQSSRFALAANDLTKEFADFSGHAS